MKTAVVVDSACDLPASYLERHQLHLLPDTLTLDNEVFTDNRDVELTLAFHHRHAQSRNPDIKTKPCSVSAIIDLFLNHLVLEYDRAILIAISQTRSSLFQNATEASFAIVRGYRERRRQVGLSTPFYLNVLDSHTVCAGQAVLAHQVVRLLGNPDLPFNELRRSVEEFRRHIRCYLLLDDLSHLRQQAGGRNDDGVGFLNYRLGTLLGV